MTKYKKITSADRDGGETTYVKMDEHKAGDVLVEGVFKRKHTETYVDEDTGLEKERSTFYFKLADGNNKGLNGYTSLLKDMEHIAPGTQMQIIYAGKGKAKKGRRAPYLFDIGVAEAEASPLDKVKKAV